MLLLLLLSGTQLEEPSPTPYHKKIRQYNLKFFVIDRAAKGAASPCFSLV
jgi:hypothetical protein